MMRVPLPPGSTLGLFGGGQLGRMFAQAAARMGYHVHVFAPELDAPAAEVARSHTRASYDDLDAVHTFARSVQAVTYEFENVPATAAAALADQVPVRPQPEVLAITRHRLTEKSFLQKHGLPVTPFAPAHNATELADALTRIGASVVKTTEFGYDGKGQMVADRPDQAAAVWPALGAPREVIVEQKVDLAGECSMLVARGASGDCVFYGPFYNTHRNHILDLTVWTANDATPIAKEAQHIARTIAEAFALEGLICVELFIDQQGRLLVNEIAPRPHNSGHLTIEACSVSQFEQQVRLTAGWAPISPIPRGPAAAMVNLLGDLWSAAPPPWQAVLDEPGVSLHLYGKKEARPGRKMGHLTALTEDASSAEKILRRVRAKLGNPNP